MIEMVPKLVSSSIKLQILTNWNILEGVLEEFSIFLSPQAKTLMISGDNDVHVNLLEGLF